MPALGQVRLRAARRAARRQLAGRSSAQGLDDAATARAALEASLQRLGADYVDLYRLHDRRMDAIERDDLFEELRSELRDGGEATPLRGRPWARRWGGATRGMRALEERSVTALQTVYDVLEQPAGARLPRSGGAPTAPV